MISRRSTRARGEGEPRRHQATEPTSCPSPHMAQCISTGGHESDQAKREVDPLSTTGPSVCSRGARPSHASGTTGTRTRFSQQRARHIHSPPSASWWTWIGDTPPRPNTLVSIPSTSSSSGTEIAGNRCHSLGLGTSLALQRNRPTSRNGVMAVRTSCGSRDDCPTSSRIMRTYAIPSPARATRARQPSPRLTDAAAPAWNSACSGARREEKEGASVRLAKRPLCLRCPIAAASLEAADEGCVPPDFRANRSARPGPHMLIHSGCCQINLCAPRAEGEHAPSERSRCPSEIHCCAGSESPSHLSYVRGCAGGPVG